jgi:hypothetical protein
VQILVELMTLLCGTQPVQLLLHLCSKSGVLLLLYLVMQLEDLLLQSCDAVAQSDAIELIPEGII